LASRHVKVVLSGDGGDEAFGGYARYAHDLEEARWRKRIPRLVRATLLCGLARSWPKADWLPRGLRAKTRLTNLSLSPEAAYANTLSICRLPLRQRLLAPDVIRQLNGHDPQQIVREHYALADRADPLAGMIAADVGVLLPDDFLTKVDRASMAFGLEVRPPLVDHELLELAAGIPSDLKVRQGETKWLFKRTYAERLPASVTGRPKQGFEIPVDQWLRGPLRGIFEQTVLSPTARVAELLDRRTVSELYRQHLRGTARHGQTLWSLLVLGRWAETYLRDGRIGRPDSGGTAEV
jgi:asparagine synthase (glutamine-hydrolysing)